MNRHNAVGMTTGWLGGVRQSCSLPSFRLRCTTFPHDPVAAAMSAPSSCRLVRQLRASLTRELT